MSSLDADGRTWARGAVATDLLEHFIEICGSSNRRGARLELNGALGALLAAKGSLNEIAARYMHGAHPVRAVAFEKSSDLNWSLGWHQDRVIAVAEHAETPGYTNWSNKAGIWHVEPPVEVLSDMIFLRLHLDPSTAENGCMQVSLGSHASGYVRAADAEATALHGTVENTIAEAGDVLIARALILHRSGVSQTSDPRRALRIDYARGDLPPPLSWTTRRVQDVRT
jgi:hypothetical protein